VFYAAVNSSLRKVAYLKFIIYNDRFYVWKLFEVKIVRCFAFLPLKPFHPSGRLDLFYKQRFIPIFNQKLFINLWQTTTKKKI
jgi:hypothetical protein